MSDSIGVIVDARGSVRSVSWDGAAYRAGIAPGAMLVAVNAEPFSSKALVNAVAASPDHPVTLALKTGDGRETVELAYRGGLRYPHLRRINDVPDRLNDLLQPRILP